MDLDELNKAQKKACHSVKWCFNDIDEQINADGLDITKHNKDNSSQHVKDYKFHIETAMSSINEKFKQLDKNRHANSALIAQHEKYFVNNDINNQKLLSIEQSHEQNNLR